MLNFQFGGKDSFKDFGILITKRPTVPAPKRRITAIDIPGRNSSLHFDENTYEDITVTVECSVKDTVSITDKIDDIKGWLLGTGESNLIFDFQPNKKYIAQVVNSIDFKQVYKILGQFIMVFNCRPFKYEVTNSIIDLTSSGIVKNIGTIYSEPIIKVYGSGDITLNINTQVVKLTGITDHIIINTSIEDCYNESLENLNSKINSELPVLNVGENNISWTGNVTKVEIIPNWRWL